jgi:hypothetical protein
VVIPRNFRPRGFLSWVGFTFLTRLLAVASEAQTLVAYWTFDDGSGTTATDSSGNGHSAKLFNGISWVSGQINDDVSANASRNH